MEDAGGHMTMMRSRFGSFALVLSIGAISACTKTEPMQPTAPETPMPEVSSADAGFLREAAIGGLEEVKLGKLAAEKASDPEIRKYGEMMVSDHTGVNTKLSSLAQDKR